MLVVPLIERKRDGGAVTPEEWSALIAAYSAGRVPDYQMAALLMAVFLRGLERQELAAVNDAMLASGERLSCRGWGHTSGTLDKLEAIPGFRTALSLAEAAAQVRKLGVAMFGQTPEIAPD